MTTPSPTAQPTPVEAMAVDLAPTSRGFLRAEFRDFYGETCSLQESSLATESAIWLGVNEAGGKPARMHLTREMAAGLLPHLQQFVATGALLPAPTALRAHLSQHPEQAGVVVPKGFVLVPREPTQAMLWASEEAYTCGYTGTPFARPGAVWKAMVAAVPARPTPPAEPAS